MDESEYKDSPDNDGPGYRKPEDIAQSELRAALGSLILFGGDLNLTNQAMNLALVDEFIMKLELELLRRQFHEERTPIDQAVFVSAQSQMWIFAAYELLRTWRQLAAEIIKWVDNGRLEAKLTQFRKTTGFQHFGREFRARQIESVLADPSLVQKIRDDVARTYTAFAQIEFLRVSIAKHEVRGQKNSVALMPTYGRINRWCGSIDFDLEHGRSSIGTLSRRDIADTLRLIPTFQVPTAADVLRFKAYMRGPPNDIDWGPPEDISESS